MIRLEECREDVFVELLDFGGRKGTEFVTANADGSYTIFINSRVSYFTQREALEHAVRHIENHDFEKHDVQAIEAYAHQIAQEKQKEVEEKQREQEQKRLKELHDYWIKKHEERQKQLHKELEEYERFITTYIALNPDYYEAIERKYYDPDDPYFKF